MQARPPINLVFHGGPRGTGLNLFLKYLTNIGNSEGFISLGNFFLSLIRYGILHHDISSIHTVVFIYFSCFTENKFCPILIYLRIVLLHICIFGYKSLICHNGNWLTRANSMSAKRARQRS